MAEVVFADNDVILKLAEYDLISETCKLLSTGSTDVYTLRRAENVFRSLLRKLRAGSPLQWTEPGLERAIAFAQLSRKVMDTPQAGDFQKLIAVDGIDPGEALLIVSALDSGQDSIFVTGDKNCLRALAQGPATSVYEKLRRRVMCLEQLIDGLVASEGIDRIRNAVSLSPECDKTISIAFGSRFSLPESEVLSSLAAYIADLTQYVGEDWLAAL